MNRIDAIKAIGDALDNDDLIIATTGEISRELYMVKDNPQNFYMQGSMGLASSIGLGLALALPNRRTIVIEGDGSILMNMGSMATIGNILPTNLIHIILDNESYDSCGSQVSSSSTAKLEKVAKAVGYNKAIKINSRAKIMNSLLSKGNGPSFILIKVEKGGPHGIPRVGIKPDENKYRFQKFLKLQ